MKKIKLLLSLSLVIILCTSCSSDDDDASNNGNGNGNNSEEQLAVYMVGTSNAGFDVQYSNTTFCYENEDCETITGMSFVSTFGSDRLDMEFSSANKIAEGVLIENIQITSGSGYFEVVSGTQTSDGFEDGTVLFTSAEFTNGETTDISWGRTE